jgi:hypothetical protein
MALYAKIDVAFARDPDLVGLPLARLMYVQCLLYARENLTDGAIDSRLLSFVAVDIQRPRRHMDALVKAGKLEETPDGWRIPGHVWRKFNPTKDEVAAIIAAKGEAGALGNHRRWHRTEPSPDCRYCIANASQNGSHDAKR